MLNVVCNIHVLYLVIALNTVNVYTVMALNGIIFW